MPDLRSRIRDRKEHVTAPMATLGATRNPREVLLHPHGTQILGFWYRALVLAPAGRVRIGRTWVEPVEWLLLIQPRRNKLGSDGCTS